MTKEQLDKIRKDPLLTLANTPTALLLTVLFTWLLFALFFMRVESSSLEDALYWSVTTISTTGYGDVTPETAAGKIVAGSLMLWSIFYLLPCTIFHIADKLIVVPDEFNDDDKHELQEQLDRIELALNAQRSST